LLVDELGRRLVGLRDTDHPAIVGCSGGPDSVALLVLAVRASLQPVAVHVDHGLRDGSDTESAVVADLAARFGVPFVAEAAPVVPGPNLEARAREARYAALERARRARGAPVVLVAHTADDQAETVLLNLLRGGASAGLGGMGERRDALVRPLLGIRRFETEALCAEQGLVPLRDPSNDDTRLRRNWIRHDVLPLLNTGAARDLVPILSRQAALFRSESEFLDELARASWAPDGTASSVELQRLPTVLARRAVRQWLGPPPPSLADVERVLAVAGGECRATEVAGGRRVWRSRGRLYAERGTVTA
jgi:tRNA(Ile)-lysidine synthase